MNSYTSIPNKETREENAIRVLDTETETETDDIVVDISETWDQEGIEPLSMDAWMHTLNNDR